ncbi:hypothetical protein, partial [Serratia marcescens]|uniref:hypothetical protein n=1 Tax=Serratia marcescens TaxID=615 RepID=UPI0028145B07
KHLHEHCYGAPKGSWWWKKIVMGGNFFIFIFSNLLHSLAIFAFPRKTFAFPRKDIIVFLL